ncbi:altered inheritance of mitochondria protein 32-like [Actinidia eriantha]|uniref:altered inheritance of mitochondria protein 32-like n=1 Tax=Actinidia eriantha TaxID=165200 RepID=UPI0025837954|nr:altered inheritance of mitochondria protein 32-like [Actinidia eriantha]
MRSAHPGLFPIPQARSLSSLAFFFNYIPATARPLSRSSPPNLFVSAMAGAAEKFSPDAGDIEFGFRRPEMYKGKLAGTVESYGRHVFLCYKSYESWPSRVEDSESEPVPKLLSAALKVRKNDINVKTRLTICEGREGTEFSDGDVLIFPEMIKYRCLKDSVVDGFVEDVLVNGKPWASGVQEVLSGSHVFVCAHASRDRRCGVCGPALIEKFKEEIELRGLKDQVSVSACSHVGGHKYAGNLIIFSADQEGNIAGHWYGYVTPDDVAELLEQHIGKGEIIQHLWRGKMGAPAEPAEKADELKIPNGKDLEKIEKPNGDSSQDKKDDASSCCQGDKGFSCCRDGNLEVKETTEVQGRKGPGKMSSWMRNWEERDVLTAAALVGAVATIAVAYSFYRRSV